MGVSPVAPSPRPLAAAARVGDPRRQHRLVVTGGAVRLTGSGLGCPTWPRCTDESFTPHGALDVHSAIEFGNRMLTFVLVAVAVATLRRRLAERAGATCGVLGARGWRSGIPAQAVIGGHHRAHRPEPVDRVVPPARARWRSSASPCCSCGGSTTPDPVVGARSARVAPRLADVRRRPGWCSTSAPWSPAPARTPATSTSPRNGLEPTPGQPAARRRGVPVRRAHDRAAVRAAGRRRHPACAPPRSCCSVVELAQGDRVRAVLHRPADRAGRLPHARRGPDLRRASPGCWSGSARPEPDGALAEVGVERAGLHPRGQAERSSHR